MLLGVIADDLTGASDIAGFVAAEGLSVIQYAGIPDSAARCVCDVAVVSLKSRSIPADQAVRDSLAALDWLKAQDCPRFYFKYCSTFDSTPKGNIGPVADALMRALDVDFTVLCPTLPANGRTVRGGNLYVNGTLLAESGMRHHPLNPMTDSDLRRLMEAQAGGKAGLLELATVEQGAEAVRAGLKALREEGCRYAVLDSETDAHLDILAAVLRDAPLLTGGSSLGAAVARRLKADGFVKAEAAAARRIAKGGTIVLSGSCSEMTNRQTGRYRRIAPEFRVDIERCLTAPDAYARRAAEWAAANAGGAYAPMVNATVDPAALRDIQERHGAARAARAVEGFFALLAALLRDAGVVNFIVAGGETSGSVSAALGVKAFRIGARIAPGVSWVFDVSGPFALAMKSGNFGDEVFFAKAQDVLGSCCY